MQLSQNSSEMGVPFLFYIKKLMLIRLKFAQFTQRVKEGRAMWIHMTWQWGPPTPPYSSKQRQGQPKNMLFDRGQDASSI